MTTITLPGLRRATLATLLDLNILLPVAAVVVSLLIGLLVILLIGVDLGDAIGAFFDGAFGSGYAIGASVNRAVAFAAIGLGFILANRANLTNVGGEGQIAVGAICAGAVALKTGDAGLPFGLAFMLPMLAAAAAGAVWGGVCGVLKVRVGTNEVISTLLLTFIGVWLLYWCVESVDLLRQPMTSTATLPESLEIPDATKLPLLGSPSSGLNAGLIIILLLGAVISVVLRQSTFGLRLRAAGINDLASRRAGISTQLLVMLAMAIAGAFGGLAGAIMLQGDHFVLKDGFTSGYGFDGLVVGLLARGSTLGVIVGALFFGFLRSGGLNMEMVAAVPSAVVVVIQGLIVVAVAGSAFWLERGRRGAAGGH